MVKEFSADGLSFAYPDEWALECEDNPNGWTVTLQSPGRAFAVVHLDRELERTIEEVALATLDTLKQDYPKLQAESAIETMAGEMAIGHDIEFFSLDADVTCWTRCFYGLAGIVVVMCQATGLDQEDYEPVLRAICASMRAEDEP